MQQNSTARTIATAGQSVHYRILVYLEVDDIGIYYGDIYTNQPILLVYMYR